ncbi:unnamed protein product [Lactuca saligna]|uniref:Uncharacterized protein n=1 Tax=Lactuca saligna TaxID=75948 RepID=A0AA36A1P3_LACSI|nr:unnamed protein product [Lactuca saligna]
MSYDTETYIKTMKMGKKTDEPDVAEFISAIAAENNAQLMVVACAEAAGSTTKASLLHLIKLVDSWVWSRTKSHLLPIGEGLLLMRIVGQSDNGGDTNGGHGGNNGRWGSHWVVKIDKCAGHEHVFRIRSPGVRVFRA